MFGSIGLPELILIFVVALLLFGPRKLPDVGRSLGRALGEFRRASNDLKRTLEEEVASDQLREVGREVRSVVTEVADQSVPGTHSSAGGTAEEAVPTKVPEAPTQGSGEADGGEEAGAAGGRGEPVEPR